MKAKCSTYSLELPVSLKEAVAKVSEEDGSSFNQFVVMAVAEKLSAMKTAAFFEERASRANLEEFERILNRKGGAEPAPEDRLD